jgi:ABC-2 type transport system permease protein
MTSTQGFHAIMNLFLMPLWFLSGALFPAENAMGPVRWVMRANPLSYGLEAIRRAIYFQPGSEWRQLAGCGWLVLISVALAVVMFLLASKIASAASAADLQS